jgi:hypothetical protein
MTTHFQTDRDNWCQALCKPFGAEGRARIRAFLPAPGVGPVARGR